MPHYLSYSLLSIGVSRPNRGSMTATSTSTSLRGSDRGSEKGGDRGNDRGSESYPPSKALPRSITQSVKSDIPPITKKKNTTHEKDSGILDPGSLEAISGTAQQDWDTAELPPDWERRVDKDTLKVSKRVLYFDITDDNDCLSISSILNFNSSPSICFQLSLHSYICSFFSIVPKYVMCFIYNQFMYVSMCTNIRVLQFYKHHFLITHFFNSLLGLLRGSPYTENAMETSFRPLKITEKN